MALVVLLSCLLLSNAASEQAGPNYPNTIDCNSSHPPKGYVGNTCDGEGDWSSILSRPLPEWYADMKFGMFIHWGVYSVPSYGNEWFWHNYECSDNKDLINFVHKNYGTNLSYPSIANDFHAELFNASSWVELFKSAGAQYILPVGKHHDGFCMWGSEQAPGWNAVDVGPKRDVLTELYNATMAAGLDFGIYYSQFEWFDADYVQDYRNNFTTNEFVKKKVIPQRLDLVHRYPKAMLWHTDGGWMAPDTYWGNKDWLEYLYSKSPLSSRVVSCNSLGMNCCKVYKEGQKCYEYGDAPSGGDRNTAGSIQAHYYTNQMTIQKSSWSWDRSENNIEDFLSSEELVETIVSTASWNGTTVINVGPTADGLMPPIFQERLLDIGKWMDVNSVAVHGTRPWTQGESETTKGVYFTASKDGSAYVHVTAFNSSVKLSSMTMSPKEVTMLTGQGEMSLHFTDNKQAGIVVEFPAAPPQGTSLIWVLHVKF
eukprot:m.326161 g.326161  ORF g.326161 m.326161 type:complete len:483 (+) comp16556_c0_seq12:2-1450(+)